MKATGMTRRIDNLGRVVIPKEIRQNMHLREGDALEILVDHEEGIYLKKYSMMGAFSRFAKDFALSAAITTGALCLVFDREGVIAAEGPGKHQYEGMTVTEELLNAMEQRGTIRMEYNGAKVALSTVLCMGDYAGAVVLFGEEENVERWNLLENIVALGACMLARQMEF